MPNDHTNIEDRQLSYSGGTEKQMRERITYHAYTAQQRFGELADLMARRDQPLTDDEFREQLMAHHACLYGWATVSLLGFIRDRLDDEEAFSAACMVDDIGTNGGAPYTGDLPYPPVMDARPELFPTVQVTPAEIAEDLGAIDRANARAREAEEGRTSDGATHG